MYTLLVPLWLSFKCRPVPLFARSIGYRVVFTHVLPPVLIHRLFRHSSRELHTSPLCKTSLLPEVVYTESKWAKMLVIACFSWRRLLHKINSKYSSKQPVIVYNLVAFAFIIAARARIFKPLRNPGIDSKEPISLGCVAWRAGATTLFLLGS